MGDRKHKVGDKVKKISVIIPVYNVEQYVDECLASVCSQTIADMEIICIDDGSTDGSLTLLKTWERKDSRIRLLCNDRNRGLSYTRNCGLKNAQGKYIYFLDSDDKLFPNALEYLYNLAEKEKTDCIFFSAEPIYEGSLSYQRNDRIAYEKKYPGVWQGQKLFGEIIDNNEWIAPVPFQFLSHEFLNKNNLKFFDGILHEDELFTFQIMLLAERAVCLNTKCYEYRYRENSIISSPTSQEHVRGLSVVYFEMLRFWENRIQNESLIKQFNKRLEQVATAIRKKAKLVENFDFKDICNKKNMVEIQLMNFIVYGEKLLKNVSEINDDQLRFIKTFQDIILYGAGKIGREVLQILDANDIGILGYAVSDTGNNPSYVMGHSVHGIEEWGRYKESALIIVAISKYSADELKTNLENEGFKNVLVLDQYKQ